MLRARCGTSSATAGSTTGPKSSPEVKPEPAKPATVAAAAQDGILHLGAPIDAAAQKITLHDVAKNPGAYVGKAQVHCP